MGLVRPTAIEWARLERTCTIGALLTVVPALPLINLGSIILTVLLDEGDRLADSWTSYIGLLVFTCCVRTCRHDRR